MENVGFCRIWGWSVGEKGLLFVVFRGKIRITYWKGAKIWRRVRI